MGDIILIIIISFIFIVLFFIIRLLLLVSINIGRNDFKYIKDTMEVDIVINIRIRMKLFILDNIKSIADIIT